MSLITCKRRFHWNRKHVAKLILLAFALFCLWILVSFIDVNLHNAFDHYGNPQGGTQWEHNAFVVFTGSVPD